MLSKNVSQFLRNQPRRPPRMHKKSALSLPCTLAKPDQRLICECTKKTMRPDGRIITYMPFTD